MEDTSQTITRLLFDWRGGNESALESLITLVYDDLRRLARRCLSHERRGHTLETSALVNEAYIKLLGGPKINWHDRTHFFAVAARIMRHLLIDHARTRRYAKRDAKREVTLDESLAIAPGQSCDVIALNESLERLAAIDPRKARVVELRYFLGLSVDETAQAMGVSEITVKREWLKAKSWLLCDLSGRRVDDADAMAEDR